MNKQKRAEMKKRTPGQAKQMHADWIKNRDKTIETIAKRIKSQMSSSS